MARYCFCGCGRKLNFSERGVSKRGAEVESYLQFLEAVALPAQRASSHSEEDLESFVEDGKDLRDDLADVLHGNLAARDVDRALLYKWLKTALGIKRGVVLSLR